MGYTVLWMRSAYYIYIYIYILFCVSQEEWSSLSTCWFYGHQVRSIREIMIVILNFVINIKWKSYMKSYIHENVTENTNWNTKQGCFAEIDLNMCDVMVKAITHTIVIALHTLRYGWEICFASFVVILSNIIALIMELIFAAFPCYSSNDQFFPRIWVSIIGKRYNQVIYLHCLFFISRLCQYCLHQQKL